MNADLAAIRLQGVSRSYGAGDAAMRVLGPVDLEIRCGELTLVMGPSGSGKTTLLSILGLLIGPTEGKVLLDGRDVAKVREAERARLRRDRVAFVFQHFNLIESLSALANVEVGYALAKGSPRDSRARAGALLEKVSLEGRAHALPRDLSGGEKQRVSIARALAKGGSLLLADEPTAALDGRTGERVMETLASLARDENRAVVAVTHDPRWLHIGHRTIDLEDGRIVSDSTPNRVQEEPRHESLSLPR